MIILNYEKTAERVRKMKKYKILCDADDTIENLTLHWLDVLNGRYNRNVKKEEMKIWDMTAVYPDLTKEEVLAPLYENDFWDGITPIKDSGYYLKRLIDDGHEVLIVTAAIRETFGAKVCMLQKLFPFLSSGQIVIEHNKQRLDGDILIDDAVHNLIGGRYRKILFHQPSNSNFDEREHDIMRVFNWKEVYNAIGG